MRCQSIEVSWLLMLVGTLAGSLANDFEFALQRHAHHAAI